jgi:hypothetical protein
MTKKKAVVGDIVEVKTSAGLAYLQYTHELDNMGSLVRVLPGLFATLPRDFENLTRQKELYFTFYTLRHAVRHGDAAIVSHEEIPDWAKPFPMMRHSADSHRTGKTLLWRIIRADTPFTLEELRKAPTYKELTPELEKLSTHELWPHPSMVYYLAQEWTPERAEQLRLKAVRAKQARQAKNLSPD